jgi:quinoprotein glucose dehydrogenase
MTVDGKRIDAVVQLTKQGFAFVFDRVTGRPIWPIEERPVPASDVTGEHAWPTQPFPTKPAAFAPQGVRRTMLRPHAGTEGPGAGRMQKYRSGALYTPPSRSGR